MPMRTCFSIMPFGEEFKDVERIIEAAAIKSGLDYDRADRNNQPGSVVAQIISKIRRASVVVADLTRDNPNVFYELGIAHQIHSPEQVVLIRQGATNAQYDVHQYEQLVYTHTEEGRQRLAELLPEQIRRAAEAVHEHGYWNIVSGGLARTRLIIRDLERELTAGASLSRLTIRVCAGLSSLAISNHEPCAEPLKAEYQEALLLERDTLLRILAAGARLRAIINPPRKFAHSMYPARLEARYRRMIKLLEGGSDVSDDPDAVALDRAAMQQCDLVLSPVPVPNLWIIGDSVAYEGMKRGGSGGYPVTHCETDRERVKEMIENFESFFQLSRQDTERTYPPDGRILEQMREFFAEAMEGR